jgi:hypothetical protein
LRAFPVRPRISPGARQWDRRRSAERDSVTCLLSSTGRLRYSRNHRSDCLCHQSSWRPPPIRWWQGVSAVNHRSAASASTRCIVTKYKFAIRQSQIARYHRLRALCRSPPPPRDRRVRCQSVLGLGAKTGGDIAQVLVMHACRLRGRTNQLRSRPQRGRSTDRSLGPSKAASCQSPLPYCEPPFGLSVDLRSTPSGGRARYGRAAKGWTWRHSEFLCMLDEDHGSLAQDRIDVGLV